MQGTTHAALAAQYGVSRLAIFNVMNQNSHADITDALVAEKPELRREFKNLMSEREKQKSGFLTDEEAARLIQLELRYRWRDQMTMPVSKAQLAARGERPFNNQVCYPTHDLEKTLAALLAELKTEGEVIANA